VITIDHSCSLAPARPSLADRSALLKALETQGEQTKSSVRKQRAASLKALGKEGTAEVRFDLALPPLIRSLDNGLTCFSVERTKQVQAITDKHCKEVDDLLKKAKKELAD
jgi:ribosome recycling factor